MLASWSEGPAKRAIVDFLATATTPGAGFVAVADRIAAFDNDGTLWVEQPLPPQFDFVFRTWEQEVKDAPSLAARQPYKALVEQDQAFFERAGTQDPEVVATLLEAFGRSWAGTTPEDFDAQVREWTQTVKQPQLARMSCSARWTWVRASPSTSSPRPGGSRCSRAATPTGTSRCSRRRGSASSSTTTTPSASSPTRRAR